MRERRGVLTDVVEGLRYVLHRPRLRLLVLLYVSVIMVGFPYVTVMPGLLENQLGQGAEAFAFLSLVSALGALTASLAVARYADHRIATLVFGCMGLLFGISVVVLATAPSYEVATLVVFFVGLGFGGFMTLNGAVIVRSTDPLFFGRVMSLTMLAFGGFGLMALPIGVLADTIGERGALAVLGATVCAMVSGFALLSARSRAAEGVALQEAAESRR